MPSAAKLSPINRRDLLQVALPERMRAANRSLISPATSGAISEPRMRSTSSRLGIEALTVPPLLVIPPVGVIALNRAAFGLRPGDLQAFNALGASDDDRLQTFVDQQLDPDTIPDTEAEDRIAASGFTTLDKSLQQLWADHYVADPPWQDRIRPAVETHLATFIRAVYSQRQLVQVLADFWHNHFNVYGWDSYAAPVWPSYDRDVIRPHLLGNFRQMLEAVAKSTPMLLYLDNWLSSLDGPNENYARELLELHTLGAENYYGAVPRSQVPVDGQGVAVGFVDEDVFSVTRCLTGWSLTGNPWWDLSSGDGSYFYRNDWHDQTAKNVLGIQLPASQPPEKDGQDLFDILAAHPGTGRHIARKLCRRLIGDFPPDSVVNAAAAVFTAQSGAQDQLAQVVRTILLSDEFRGSWGQKVKRPFEIAVSSLRAAGADFPFIEGNSNTETFEWLYYNTGQYLFSWHPPNGYPDMAEAWVSTSPRVMCWRLCNWLVDVDDGAGNYLLDTLAQTPPDIRSANGLADFWIDRVFGHSVSDADRQELVDFMAQGHNAYFDLPLDSDPDTRERLQAMVGLIIMSPEFLWR
jgi:hypothetical protein